MGKIFCVPYTKMLIRQRGRMILIAEEKAFYRFVEEEGL